MVQRYDYLDFLTPHNRMKARFAALVETVISQVNDLFALLDSLSDTWSLDEAVGLQLDGIGALAGVPRPGQISDEDYRVYLRARLAARQWDGTNETLKEILQFAFPDRTAKLIDNQDGTVTATLSGDAPPFSLFELFPVPVGVRLAE